LGKQFDIITGNQGEILYRFSTGNRLNSIVARNDVSVSSEQLDLHCNRLEFNDEKKILVASGKPVKILQQSLSAECGRLEYYTEQKKYLLLEDPIIINQDQEGGRIETRGDRIIILQTEGSGTSILVEGNPQFVAQAAQKQKTAKKKKNKSLSPVDESNVEKIKNLDIVKD